MLATGYFDKTAIRVTIEDAARGGIAVTFYVFELPLIGEINFEGLTIDRSARNRNPEKRKCESATRSPVRGRVSEKGGTSNQIAPRGKWSG